jgi:hypothetical protein
MQGQDKGDQNPFGASEPSMMMNECQSRFTGLVCCPINAEEMESKFRRWQFWWQGMKTKLC